MQIKITMSNIPDTAFQYLKIECYRTREAFLNPSAYENDVCISTRVIDADHSCELLLKIIEILTNQCLSAWEKPNVE